MPLADSLTTLGVLVLALNSTVALYLLYRRNSGELPRRLSRERLRAYHDIMTAIVALNRRAVELSEQDMDEFRMHADHLVFGRESEFDTLFGDMREAHQRYYFIIDMDVHEAIEEYVEYLATYHPDGAEVSKLLRLTGQIVYQMRTDLGLPNIFESSGFAEGRTRAGDIEQEPVGPRS